MTRQIDPQAIATHSNQLNQDVQALATRFGLALDLLEQWALAHPTDRHLVTQTRTLLQPSGRPVDHLRVRPARPAPAVVGDVAGRQTVLNALLTSDPMQGVADLVSIGDLAEGLADVVIRLPAGDPGSPFIDTAQLADIIRAGQEHVGVAVPPDSEGST